MSANRLKDRLSSLTPEKRALLEQLKKGGFQETSESEVIRPRDEQGQAPLSFAQQRLWFLDKLLPNRSAYNIPGGIRLKGNVKIEALEKSFEEILRRHEVLRTRYETVDDLPVQIIEPAAPYHLEVVDVRELQGDVRDAEIDRLYQAVNKGIFSLEESPLLRAQLIQTADDEYVLALCVHHIAFDGWSSGLLIKELAALYHSNAHGLQSTLPELSIQYADYALWQRKWLQGKVLQNQLSYWKEQFQGAPTLLPLPTDRPRPAVQSYEGTRTSLVLPSEMAVRVNELSKQQGVTPFMTWLSVLYTLLMRYSGEKDIVIGTPVAGRNRIELENLIGFFANTLALRINPAEAVSFSDLLRHVRKVAQGAYSHQDLPFDRLVEELQPDRDLSHHPLFQVMFAYHNYENPDLVLEDVVLTPTEIDSNTTKFDLWFSMVEHADGVFITLEYNTDIFAAETIERLKGHFQVLAEAALQQPERPIANLELLTAAERKQLLVEWNRTAVEYPRIDSLHQLVEEQVERTPDATACVFEGRELTYRELNDQANRLAHHLRSLQVTADTVVGICAERSLEMVIGLVAVLKAGGAYLPLDPDYPKERLAFMIEDANLNIVLTQQHLADELPPHDAHVIHLDELDTLLAGQSGQNLPNIVAPDNLAYVIYTSGSTGKPKGVMVPHRGVINRLQWMQAEYRLDQQDAVLQKTPFSFDVSVWEFFWPLITGAKLVVARPDGHRDSVYLVRLIGEQKITTLHFVPSMLQVFLEEKDLSACKSVKRVICSGEALSYELQERFFSRMSAELHNLYGPTEASIDVTYWPCSTDSRRRSVPIGRPVANTQLYLLDEHLQPVPIGVPGELHIGGVQVARGYLNRPELDAEKFIADPFSGDPGARLYKTGDLARYLLDGTIEYIGRIDHQVKLRGLRIELGEIEAVIAQHESVREAVVMVRENDKEDQRLIAYVTRNSDYQAAEAPVQESSLKKEQVANWQLVFDETYSRTIGEDESEFNMVGWNSSYTGEPLSRDEMKEFVGNTVNRILDQRPRRVIEVGCGTGLLLFPIAPHVEQYLGTDFSAVGLNFIRERLVRMERTLPVALEQLSADQLTELAAGSFDTLVINSVVQYFPGVDYLLRFLDGAMRLIAPGGRIFLGDIRSLPLLEAFHTSVQLHKAADEMTVEQLRMLVQKMLAEDEELNLDPAFFDALLREYPQLSGVEVLLKRGHHHNELNQFRYDVILRVGEGTQAQDTLWLDWAADGWNVSLLEQALKESAPEQLGLRGVPNARLETERRALMLLPKFDGSKMIGELRRVIDEQAAPSAVDPETLWQLAEACGYGLEIMPNAFQPTAFDVRFTKRGSVAPQPVAEAAATLEPAAPTDFRQYANNPLHAKISRQLLPELKAYAKGRLPDFMVPTHYVLLEEFPLSSNGKVDRKALPMPVLTLSDTAVAYEAPRNEIEQTLVQIWEEVLGVEQIGIRQNFFEIGGDSIKSILVISRAYRAGLELTPQQLFRNQTVVDLATEAVVLEQEQEAAATEDTSYDYPLVKLNRCDLNEMVGEELEIEDVYPLSPMQQHMFEELHANPEPGLFFVHRFGVLQGELRPDLLAQAWQITVNHHAHLRSQIAWEGLEQPVQVVAKHAKVDFEYLDLSHLSEEEQEAGIQRHLEDKWNQCMDYLKRQTPWSMLFVRIGEDLYRGVWSNSYLFMDGWSYTILNNEAFNNYGALCEGKPTEVSEGRPYLEYAVWRMNRDLIPAKAYWVENLNGYTEPVPFTESIPGNRIGSEEGFGRQQQFLSLATTEKLHGLARSHKVTVNVLIQTAWALLQSHYSGSRDIVYGVVSSGRQPAFAGIEAVVGQLMNMMPLRIVIDEQQSVQELLQHVQESQLKLSQFDITPQRKIREWINWPHEQRMFQNFMVFQNLGSFASTLDGIMNDKEIYGLSSPPQKNDFIARMEHPLRFDVFIGKQIELHMSYYRKYLTDAAITRVIGDLEAMIERITADPAQPAGELLTDGND
ncbi:hypothetical protein CIG75_10630 [Tumebacillus algifaecis]|uniref:Carrier domain-containing protein n=1 Tax=Tumebacillus algifaecis TaxID=1214604 RepID=A0A223D1A5_9BACL|nr:non-ribosomal peptide synthetase [Tumebacillus algifaecis]ASS75400.1 hypothetical protein CIG75_10630 [Tumebacillus algifaecis]